MHGDDFYVLFGGSGISDWILYRTVKGRKDFTGGANRMFTFERLLESGVAGFASAIREIRRPQAAEPKFASAAIAQREIA